MKPTQDQEHELLLRYLYATQDEVLDDAMQRELLERDLSFCRFLWWHRDASPDEMKVALATPSHWSFKKEVPVDDIVKAHNDFLADAGATMMQAEADRLAAEEPDDYGVLLGPEDEEE